MKIFNLLYVIVQGQNNYYYKIIRNFSQFANWNTVAYTQILHSETNNDFKLNSPLKTLGLSVANLLPSSDL